jgi:uncharacterized membrane protein
MSKSGVVRLLFCFVLIGFVLAGVAGDIALAAQEGNGLSLSPSVAQQVGEDKIELYAAYPAFQDISGETFQFEVELIYEGTQTRTFELSATPIPHWLVSIRSIFQEIELPEIRLEPGAEPSQAVRVILQPVPGEYPEPGEYKTTLTATSGGVEDSIELKAVVADLYRFAFFTESGRLSAEITAGEENHIAASVMNTGTATIDRIDIVGGKPEHWTLEFVPDEIENLEPGFAQEIDVIIIPTQETIAGDYLLNMRAVSTRHRAEFDLRTTVLTPTTWAWVAVVIVLLVIGGVAVMFRRLGRR